MAALHSDMIMERLLGRPPRSVLFSDLSVEELRERARATGPGDWGAYDRAMLEAFFYNRLRRRYFDAPAP